MVKGWFGSTAFLGLLAAAAGCSGGAGAGDVSSAQGADSDERTDSTSAALTAIPSWLKPVNAEWGCGDAIPGTFAGTDSAHRFAVEGKKGRAYTFRFKADYADGRGAALAVYDAAGQRVALERKAHGTEVELTFTAANDGALVLGAYAVTPRASGTYTLRQICEVAGQNAIHAGDTTFSHLEAQERFFHRGMLEARSDVAQPAAAPGGRSGEVKEADVYKIDGDRLFYLNTYRGFLVYDLADAQNPRLVSRLPIYGQPIEMFVEGSTVYALVKDALEVTPRAGKLIFDRKNVSRLVAIDVSNAASPRLLQSVDVEGELEEGVSRKVGDVVYLVSQKRWSDDPQAHVYSFNVANPRAIRKTGQLEIFRGGSYARSEADGWQSRHFGGVAISATANTLHVVENWQVYESVNGAEYSCGRSTSLQQAKVSIIDISDPNGAIRVHSKFDTYGELGDQFKHTYSNGTYYGIFARREWASADCTGTSRVENTLEAWDVTSGARPQKVGSLSFGKPNETVRGSTFDLERGVAFAITAERVDPLYAIDISNPRKLAVKSAVDGLSGDMNVFRFIGDKKFIMAIGTDTSDACTGFDSPATGFSSKVAASIIDVRDLAKIRLVQRKCVTVKGATWIGSQVNWDLDQAHKMIGMHSDGQVNAITVPVHYYAEGESRTAVGLMAWDLGKYDPSKDEKHQTVLEGFGTVTHPAGQVKRAIVFTHRAEQHRKLLALSSTHLSLTDIQDMAAPRTDAVVEVAPYHSQVFVVGNYVVEQVMVNADEGYSPEGIAELRVKSRSGQETIARVRLRGVERVLQVGSKLVAFTRDEQYKLFAKVVDLSSPTSPRVGAAVQLPVDYLPYGFRANGDVVSYGWDESSGLTIAGDRVVFLAPTWNDAGTMTWKLVELDLARAASPVTREHVLASDPNVAYTGVVTDADGRAVLVNVRTKTGEKDVDGTLFETVTYHAERWDARAGAALAKCARINVPGRVLKAQGQGRGATLLTSDKTFEELKWGGFRHNVRLHLVARGASQVTELAAQRFAGKQLKDLALDGGTLFVNLKEAHSSRWWGPMFRGPGVSVVEDTSVVRPIVRADDELAIFDLAQRSFERTYQETLGTDGVEILAAKAGRLFLSLPGDGVLVVDARDPAHPVSAGFVRTLGGNTEIAVAPDAQKAFVAAGHYGVYTVGLGR